MNDEQYKAMSNSLMSAHDKFDDIKAEMNRKLDAIFKKIDDLNGRLTSHVVSTEGEPTTDEIVDLSKEDWVAE